MTSKFKSSGNRETRAGAGDGILLQSSSIQSASDAREYLPKHGGGPVAEHKMLIEGLYVVGLMLRCSSLHFCG